MSVVKSKRHESEMEFIHVARELQIYTLRKCVKFPKRYSVFISQPMVSNATKAYQFVVKSMKKLYNSLFVKERSSNETCT